MTQIQIINLRKYDVYTEISYKLTFVLPAIYGSGANPIAGLSAIVSSLGDGYSLEVIPVDGTVITYSKISSISSAATQGQIQTSLVSLYTTIRTALDALILSPYDTLAGLIYNGSSWVTVPTVSSFKGRACSFRTPGRAGTAGQKILSLHNASGSIVIVTINKVVVDLYQTVIKAITVAPPMVRLWKVTVLPTNGTVLAKNKIGGTGLSDAAITVRGDASADGTGSGTTLTATLPAGAILTQEFAPRYVTAVGYEPADRMEFLGDTKIILGALEGVVVFLDYILATQNPTTDQWVCGVEWAEELKIV